MAERELLTVPIGTAAAASEVYSGVARMAGVLWCSRVRAHPGRRADTAVVVVHPSSNFLGHYALGAWAERGVDAVAMTTRYLGNDSVLLLENCVLDIASVITHLRAEGYEKVVLVGNSGGGGLVALYQEQARHPSITAAPYGGGPDLTKAHLPPADALVMLMAHPGRANLLVEWLDPAVRDEDDPFDRDPELDMFAAHNGPPYAEEWLVRYRAAQRARNERITDSVIAKLYELAERGDGKVTDLPIRIHATCADPRNVDLSIDPSDRAPGTLWGEPYEANLRPTTLGHLTSLRSWLSQWSIRTSHGDGPARLASVDVPVYVIYGTADQACFPSHARQLHDAVPHDNKLLTAVEGGRHYLNGQPELTAVMADALIGWIGKVL
ncbi:alpha/beta hydrolase [Spongiactinospora gelatinilytica]|uniref:Alpha/beta hydrolase n=1 Tax=Spongiactinospora gelatinilytica TaxID=2666298 RepID=A0A2W2J272_9ACTN|nr:alpha/beta hydrolase [Spongiactinospora gelatinilytica]PZG55684.1 alpha/beta hydrolase [Spongiactinospora gelatinilytica]